MEHDQRNAQKRQSWEYSQVTQSFGVFPQRRLATDFQMFQSGPTPTETVVESRAQVFRVLVQVVVFPPSVGPAVLEVTQAAAGAQNRGEASQVQTAFCQREVGEVEPIQFQIIHTRSTFIQRQIA